MQISVVIPTVRPAHLGQAIESVCRQTLCDWELIVVAQGNNPELTAFVERGHPDKRVRFLHLTRSGTSVAKNAGIEAARGPIVAFTDDDCEAREDWLALFVQTFARQADVGLIGGALVKPTAIRKGLVTCPTITPSEAIYDPLATPQKPPAGWEWVGANFAVRREVLAQIGPFDTYLGPGGHFPIAEDTDYGFRLERAGIKMMSTPRSIVHHTHGCRYGLKAVLRSSRNYARGNAAMAAKLTLQGDPRGEEWLRATHRECTVEALRSLRLHRLPIALNRWNHFRTAYQECVTHFRVNAQGVLEPHQSTNL